MDLVSKKRSEIRSAIPGGKAGFGSIGQKIKVNANHYPITLPANGTIYHYDLDLKEQAGGPEPQQKPPPKDAAKAKGGAGKQKGGRQQPPAALRAAAGDAPAAGPSGAGGGAPGPTAGAGGRPARMPKRLKRQIVELWQEQNKAFFANGTLLGVYDGEKNFYTFKKMSLADGEAKEFVVQVPADVTEGFRARNYILTVKLAAQLRVEDLHAALSQPGNQFPTDILTALQCVMREALTRWCPVPARSFFFPEGKFDLGGDRGGWSAKDAWPGIFMSLRPNQFKITLNLDISHTALSKKQAFDDFYANFVWHDTKPGYNRDGFDVYNPNARMPPPQAEALRKKVERLVYGLKVETTHSGIRRWRCCGISPRRLNELDFPLSEGGRQKVVDYFRTQYGITVPHPHLPAVMVGSKTNPKYLPMTLCTIMEGQRMGRKLAEEEVSTMVRNCAKPAMDRKRQIEGIRNNAVATTSQSANDATARKKPFEQTDNVYMKEFGISVQRNMAEVDARLLPVPVITGGSGPIRVNTEEATFDPTKGNNVVPCRRPQIVLTDWAIINLSRERRLDFNALDQFLRCLCEMGRARFGTFPKPSNYHQATDQIDPSNFKAAYQSLKANAFKGQKPQMLMVITPRKNSQEYALCKQFFDITEGVKTQMVAADVLAKQIEKGLAMYVSNLLLKINAKLNGANQMVAYGNAGMHKQVNDLPGLKKLFATPTMVFGADVTHPSPGMSSVTPSIAAVTASVDKSFCEFRARVRAQEHRQEIIEDMDGIAVELISEFQAKNNRLPMQIIFYRDGVSEGQLQSVWTNEFVKLRKACAKFGPEYKPGITYIIVGKRHHTRLFPKDRGVGRAGNVAPGTIVDSGICHYSELDYYLCSHFGIQGTSRPAHYHVLADFNDLDVDTLQVLSYYLCYAYQKCLRAVSIPAPAYYAHHAAFRARAHLDSVFREGDGSDTMSVLSTDERREETRRMLQRYNEQIQLHDNVRNTQYFC